MTKLKQFIKKLAIITIVLAVLSFIVFSYTSEAWTTNVWTLVLLFFFISNGLLYWLFLGAQQKKLSTFANFFMLSTSLKLLVYLAIIIVYLIFNREDAPPFLLSFFIYYIAYTGFEVKSIIKTQKQSENGSKK
ncbi:MAG: hypothetical protein Q7V19_13215 [Bacteroidales bacterium]|nr:hypothetical protein [Bacteroidales bacterium]